MGTWHFESDGMRQGPVSSAELRELALLGVVQPTTLVWKQGMSNGVEASRIKGLQFGTNQDARHTETVKTSAPKAEPILAAVPTEPRNSRRRLSLLRPQILVVGFLTISVIAALGWFAVSAIRTSSSRSQSRPRTAHSTVDAPSDGPASLVLGATSPAEPDLETDGISLGMTLAQVRRVCTVRQPALTTGELWPIVYGGSLNGATGGEEFEFLFDRRGELVAYQKRLFRDSSRTAVDRIVARFGKTEKPVFSGDQGNSFAWYHFEHAVVGALVPSRSDVRLSVWSKPWLVGELERLDSGLRRQNLKTLQQCWAVAGRSGASGDDLPAPSDCTWTVRQDGMSMQNKLTETTFFLRSSKFQPTETVGSVSSESAVLFDGGVSAAEDVDVLADILEAQNWRKGLLITRGSDSEFLVISGLYPLATYAISLIVADYFPPTAGGIEWRGAPSNCYSWQSGQDTQVYVDGLRVTLKRMR